MQDGRVSMTTEKVDSNPNAATPFYQLAGRRINWDLTDYHPLLAQRAQSTDTFTADLQPSVDYQQATEIREGLDRNFLIILSDDGAQGGAGALATFNRSIGPFQADRTEVTFLRAVRIIDPAATGKAGTAGVYRSPFSLPNGEILASYDGAVTDPAAQTPRFALVAVNEQTGARRMLASDGSLSYVEAALGYKRAERLLFSNLPQLVFGGHTDGRRHRHRHHALPRRAGAGDAAGREPAPAAQRRGHGPRDRPQGLRGDAARERGTPPPRRDVARHGVVRVGPLAEGDRAGGQAADPRVHRRQRQSGIHDDRGASGDGRANTSPRAPRAPCSTTSAAAATAASAGPSWTSPSVLTR